MKIKKKLSSLALALTLLLTAAAPIATYAASTPCNHSPLSNSSRVVAKEVHTYQYGTCQMTTTTITTTVVCRLCSATLSTSVDTDVHHEQPH